MAIQDRNGEFHDWVQSVRRWKSRQRKIKQLLTRINQLLRRREEVLEEALWMRATAENNSERLRSDDTLSETLAAAQRDHAATLRQLHEILHRLEETDLEELVERPASVISHISSDPVEEATRESFPASDPPSFNPGRA